MKIRINSRLDQEGSCRARVFRYWTSRRAVSESWFCHFCQTERGHLWNVGRDWPGIGKWTNSVAEGSDNYLHVAGNDWAIGDLTDDMYSQTKFVKYVIRTTSGVAKEKLGRRCGRSPWRPCSNVGVSARHTSLMASDHRVCTEELYGNPRLHNAHALIITRGTSF